MMMTMINGKWTAYTQFINDNCVCVRERTKNHQQHEKSSIRKIPFARAHSLTHSLRLQRMLFCLLFMPHSKLFWEPRIFISTLLLTRCRYSLICFVSLRQSICSWEPESVWLCGGVCVWARVNVCWRTDRAPCLFMCSNVLENVASEWSSDRVLFCFVPANTYKHTHPYSHRGLCVCVLVHFMAVL